MKKSTQNAHQELLEYYRIAASSLPCPVIAPEHLPGPFGFFQFHGQICYGQSQSGTTPDVATSAQFDASNNVLPNGHLVQLRFNFAEVINNLRLERYQQNMAPEREAFARTELLRKLYYLVRGALPVSLRRRLQRAYFSDWQALPFPAWPVDFTVDLLHQQVLRALMEAGSVKKVPFIWFWPDGAASCLIMTHDVETAAGRDFSSALMDLDDSFGIKASFQIIPEKRYKVSDEYVSEIRRRGFELNIHDLNHDGNLYGEREQFNRRAERINGYLRSYGARGFRAGSMYRRQDWYDVFEFSYDMSVPNVAHLEPMRGGCCTVMPYFVAKAVELPLTLTQDYSLFHILGDYSTNLWKEQAALIRRQNGLMSFIVHPDYLVDRRAREVYKSLLQCIRHMVVEERVWNALPGDVERWWRARGQMNLVPHKDGWEITGPENQRARLAYAVLDGDHVVYELDEIPSATTVQ
jgi:hypothetical protein